MGVRSNIGLALLCGCLWLGTQAEPAFGSALPVEQDYGRLIDTAKAQYGSRGAQALSHWLAMLEEARSMSEIAQLQVVNDFWNTRLREASDDDVWRQVDYWATPMESLGMGLGDCEDFVIGKYFSLVQLGVEPGKLRLVYVRAKSASGGTSKAHMVLGYYANPQVEPLILDNLKPHVLGARNRRDLTPVFSFNVNGIYVPGAKPASVDRIGRWQALLKRMRHQGFRP